MTAMKRSDEANEAKIMAMDRHYPEPDAVERPKHGWTWRHHQVTLRPPHGRRGLVVACSCGFDTDGRAAQDWAEGAEHLRKVRSEWRDRVTSFPT